MCTVQRIYDQSPKGNHLTVRLNGVNATKSKVIVGGHHVYAAYFEGRMGYRNDTTTGVAKGDEPESMLERIILICYSSGSFADPPKQLI